MRKLNYCVAICLFLLANYSFSQVKIGQNPNTIHQASIIELESSEKVFVLTRVSDTEMNAIVPLAGAMVYNTDHGCVYQYNGANWIGLCDSIAFNETTTTIVDNNDGTFSYLNEDNTTITITKAMLSDNGDGTFNFDNGSGAIINFIGTDNQDANQVGLNIPLDVDGDGNMENTVQEAISDLAGVSTDNQNLNTDSTPGNISIDNGNTISLNVDDSDADATNELSDLSLSGTTIELTNPEAGATGVDLDTTFATDAELAAAADDDITGASYDDPSTTLTITEGATSQTVNLSDLEESADVAANATDIATNTTDIATNSTDIATNANDITTNTTAITAHIAADGDLDDTNELSDLSLSGTTIELTNPEAGATGVDLDTTFATDAELAAAADDDITGASYDDPSTTLTITEGATSQTVNLSDLEESADVAANATNIATNATDIATNTTDIATNTTDIATNATDIATNSTDIATNSIDIATNATDIATNATDIATNTTDIATNATDIATNSTDIATNATDIATNATDIATNAIAITAHIAADGDLDDTNELSDISISGTTIELTNPEAGATGVDLDATFATDAELAAVADDDITGASYDDPSTTLTITEGATSQTVNLSDLEESADVAANATNIATNATDIATNTTEIATNTTDIATNATDIATNSTDIATNVTDIATNSTDIATNATDIATNSTDIATNVTNIATNVTDIATNATDIATNTTDIATNATDIAAHVAADGDLDDTNELSDISLSGTTIELTNPEAGASGVDLDTAFATDAELAAAADDDITGASYDDPSTTLTITEGATSQTVNLSDLEESTDVAANATDIATNTTDIATNVTDIATNVTDIATNATDIATNATDIATNTTDIATNSTDIATNATDIAAHIAADGDLDDTNELSDLSLSGTTIELTNPEAGATGVDLDATFATDAELAAAADDDITGASYDDPSTTLTITEGATSQTVNLSDLEESADVAANATDIATNATDIATNTTDIATNSTDIATNTTDIVTNTTDIATNATDITTNATDIATNSTVITAHIAADGDLDDTNEIQTLTKTGNTIALSLGGGSVNEAVTSLTQNTTTGLITYTNEATTNQTANVVGAETNNNITVGANGGAFFDSMVKGIGKISSAGGVVKASTGITVTKLGGNGRYRVNLPNGMVSDANYIIHLTQPGRGGAGNDDPGISYNTQTATSFEVIIGDNDNGGTNRARYNSEFMFIILDL